MTSTIKRRPRGYRTGISSEVFEFVMKLLRDTLGTTGRYLDLMRINAPLRIQGPDPRTRRGIWDSASFIPLFPRQFYSDPDEMPRPYTGCPHLIQYAQTKLTERDWTHPTDKSRHVHWREKRLHDYTLKNSVLGSLVPFRHTYNASRII
jgi:hypothetical protein